MNSIKGCLNQPVSNNALKRRLHEALAQHMDTQRRLVSRTEERDNATRQVSDLMSKRNNYREEIRQLLRQRDRWKARAKRNSLENRDLKDALNIITMDGSGV